MPKDTYFALRPVLESVSVNEGEASASSETGFCAAIGCPSLQACGLQKP